MLPEGGDKARPHLHAESVYKEYQAEVLDHSQHICIGSRTEVRKEDADEEYPRHSQSKSLDLSLAQIDPDRTDCAE